MPTPEQIDDFILDMLRKCPRLWSDDNGIIQADAAMRFDGREHEEYIFGLYRHLQARLDGPGLTDHEITKVRQQINHFRHIIFCHGVRLATQIILQFQNREARKFRPGDICSIADNGYNALVNTLDKFDPSKARWSTYLTRAVTNNIISGLRGNSVRNADLIICDPNVYDMVERHGHFEANNSCEFELRELVARVLDSAGLSALESMIIKDRFGFDDRGDVCRSLVAVGKRHGMSNQSVLNIERQAISKMRECIELDFDLDETLLATL